MPQPTPIKKCHIRGIQRYMSGNPCTLPLIVSQVPHTVWYGNVMLVTEKTIVQPDKDGQWEVSLPETETTGAHYVFDWGDGVNGSDSRGVPDQDEAFFCDLPE